MNQTTPKVTIERLQGGYLVEFHWPEGRKSAAKQTKAVVPVGGDVMQHIVDFWVECDEILDSG